MIFGCTLFWIDFSPDFVTYYHLVCFPCFSSTSCSICYVFTIQASVRRRLRRARAVARYKWWLYRTGGIDRRLHVPVLSWILRTLSGHHSRDFKHLSTVQRHLKAAMAYTESQPWRCGPCKRLVKAKPQFCPNCGSWWEDVYDRSYQPSMQRHAEDQSWTWNAWQDSSQRRPKTPARRQSRSSSARRKGKRAEKGKEKGKEKGREKGKDKGTEVISPFSNTLMSPPPAPTPFPTLQNSAMSSMMETTSSGSQSQPGAELIAAIKKAFPDSSSLPAEIKEALDKTEVAVTKDLHRATSALGHWAGPRNRSGSWKRPRRNIVTGRYLKSCSVGSTIRFGWRCRAQSFGVQTTFFFVVAGDFHHIRKFRDGQFFADLHGTLSQRLMNLLPEVLLLWIFVPWRWTQLFRFCHTTFMVVAFQLPSHSELGWTSVDWSRSVFALTMALLKDCC